MGVYYFFSFHIVDFPVLLIDGSYITYFIPTPLNQCW